MINMEFLQQFLQQDGVVLGLVLACFLLGVVVAFVVLKKNRQAQDKIEVKTEVKIETETKVETKTEAEKVIVAEIEAIVETKVEEKRVEEKIEIAPPSLVEQLTKGLTRSRQLLWGKLGSIIHGQHLGATELEAIEEVLYGADLGPKMVLELTAQLTQKLKDKEVTLDEMKSFLWDFLWVRLSPIQQIVPVVGKKPEVILIAGINGAGKTTTIGKLATKYAREGKKVYVGACDTFRAAAVDQLQVWCDRAGATMIRAKEGGDPSGVAYETLQQAIKEGADVCLLDTAGRLHTKANLMDELKKLQRVLSKLMPDAPHRVALVLDAITGQNATRQAEEFHKTLGVTELILTKCDGSSKAGSVVGIMQELKIPVSYIGIGESVDDLKAFSLDDYLKALLDHRVSEQLS